MNRVRFPSLVRISAMVVLLVITSMAAAQTLAAPEPSPARFSLASLAAPAVDPVRAIAMPELPAASAIAGEAEIEPAADAPFELVALRFRAKSKSRCVCTQAGDHCACRSGECGDVSCRVRPAQPKATTPPTFEEPERLVLRRVVVGYRYRRACGVNGCQTVREPIWAEQYFRE